MANRPRRPPVGWGRLIPGRARITAVPRPAASQRGGLGGEVQAAVAGDQRAATRSLIALLLNHCFSAAAARRFVTSTVGRFGHCDFRSTAARGTLVDFTFL